MAKTTFVSCKKEKYLKNFNLESAKIHIKNKKGVKKNMRLKIHSFTKHNLFPFSRRC